MAIPSFDELLSQARQVAQTAESARTGTALAKGLSEGFTKAFLTPPAGTKQFEGYLTPEGEVVNQPYRTGQSLVERGFGKLFGREQFMPPVGSVGITQEQGAEFQTKRILEKQKGEQAVSLEEKRQTGRESLQNLKNAARNAAFQISGSRIGLDDIMPVEIWKAGLADLGYDPNAGEFSTPRTYRAFNVLSIARNRNSQDFFREIGVDLQLSKDILGQPSEEGKKSVREKMQKRKTPFSGFGKTDKIRVIKKATGEHGELDMNEFDSTIYERE